ncbi:hypothetical protein GBA52_027105 [Prunus armeniaca]|nr:hypothetical protein GBA52_027105 [Prunus armeniaca]
MGHLKSMRHGSLIKAIYRVTTVRQNHGWKERDAASKSLKSSQTNQHQSNHFVAVGMVGHPCLECL